VCTPALIHVGKLVRLVYEKNYIGPPESKKWLSVKSV